MRKEIFFIILILSLLFYSGRIISDDHSSSNASSGNIIKKNIKAEEIIAGDFRLADTSWAWAFRNIDSNSDLNSKFIKSRRKGEIFDNDYYSLEDGIVSPWDNIIKNLSDSLNWDWRLIIAVIYQESRFDPNVRSWVGANGLMQIMPETGKKMGIDFMASPENNLKAGMLYLNYLQNFFSDKIKDSTERMKFVLGAYNAGPGNIVDAMKLAGKHGKDPLKWDKNVAVWLLKKSDPRYYNDPVVENGFCRGYESVNFVSQILERYEEYKTIIPARKDSPF